MYLKMFENFFIFENSKNEKRSCYPRNKIICWERKCYVLYRKQFIRTSKNCFRITKQKLKCDFNCSKIFEPKLYIKYLNLKNKYFKLFQNTELLPTVQERSYIHYDLMINDMCLRCYPESAVFKWLLKFVLCVLQYLTYLYFKKYLLGIMNFKLSLQDLHALLVLPLNQSGAQTPCSFLVTVGSLRAYDCGHLSRR